MIALASVGQLDMEPTASRLVSALQAKAHGQAESRLARPGPLHVLRKYLVSPDVGR
jgi:hypothetical protein